MMITKANRYIIKYALLDYTKNGTTVRGGSRGDQSDHATKVKIGQKIGKLK